MDLIKLWKSVGIENEWVFKKIPKNLQAGLHKAGNFILLYKISTRKNKATYQLIIIKGLLYKPNSEGI